MTDPALGQASEDAKNASLFVQGTGHMYQRPEKKLEKRTYDHALARKKMSYLTTHPQTGEIVDIQRIINTTPEAIPEMMELVNPLLTYIGPGTTLLPANGYLLLKTSQRILDVRREYRPAIQGLALGDRTFKRCYQNALRDRQRYFMASDSLQTEAHKAGYTGINIVFDGTETRDGRTYPRIRRANANERGDAVLRSPPYAAMKAFDILNDKPWHHWLLPFGCFFYENMPNTHDSWKAWCTCMSQGRNPAYLINPYSVTSGDVRNLLSSPGYFERYRFVIGVINFLKTEMNFNLLQCHRLPSCTTSDNAFRRFLTLERYFYLFGSIHMHFIESKGACVETGCPDTWRNEFQRLWGEAVRTFAAGTHPKEEALEYAQVRTVRTTQMLSAIFPMAELMTADKLC